MSEGEIFYSIEYIKNPSSFSKDLMPKELVIAFKGDKINTELRAPIGNSGISMVTNPKMGIYDTYVNMLAFKYYYEGYPMNLAPGFSTMKNLTYHETGKKSQICGFTCNEVQVNFPEKNRTFNIWYTSDIDVTSPNQLTPYFKIKGVLMDFYYIMGEAEMRFRAREVYNKEVPEKNFEKKKNYKSVSGGYLDSLILKMIAF